MAVSTHKIPLPPAIHEYIYMYVHALTCSSGFTVLVLQLPIA